MRRSGHRRALLIGVVLLAGVAAAALLIGRLLDADSVRAAVERQASAYLGQPVKVSAVHWSLLRGPRAVLTDVEIGFPPGVTLARVEMTTGLRGLLSRRVEHATVIVSRGRVALPIPLPLGKSHGTGATAGGSTGGEATGLAIASIDRILLDDMDLVSGQTHVRLDLQSSLAGDRLHVSTFTLKSPRTTISGSGEFTSLSAGKGRFSAVGDPLDLDEWLAIAAAGAASTGRIRLPPDSTKTARAPLEVRVELEAPRGRLLGLPFKTLKTTAALTANAVTLAPLTIGLFDGTVNGRIGVDTSGARARARLTALLEGVDVAQLAAAAGHPGVLTGRLRGELLLTTDAGPLEVMTRSAAGTARVVVTDGTAPGLDLVRPVILAFGRPDPGESAAPSRSFSRLAGTFALAGGVLRSDDLVMNARDVDLRGRGTLDVARAAVDMKADLVLSESLSAQAGRDLIRYAHEGTRVVVPATITGSLAAPSVSIDTAAALGRALRNMLGDKARKLFKR